MAAIRLPKEYHRCQRNMQKAILRGDLEASFRWLELAARLLAMAHKETDLYDPQRKFPKHPTAR